MYLELFMNMLLLDDAGVGCEMRYSYKRIQYNQKPRRAKLSDEQIQRLNDTGFVRWYSRARRGRQSSHRRTHMNHHPLPLLAIRQRPVSGKWKIRAVTQRQQITATASSKSELFVFINRKQSISKEVTRT
jgi:hypothetical protein